MLEQNEEITDYDVDLLMYRYDKDMDDKVSLKEVIKQLFLVCKRVGPDYIIHNTPILNLVPIYY